MVRYLIRRMLVGLMRLFVFLVVMYFLVNLFIPGDAVSGFILPAEELEALRHELGLDRPLMVQFLDWLSNLVSGSLGESVFGAPVASSISNVAPATVFVLAAGLGLAFVFGTWLGRWAGWRKGIASESAALMSVALYTAFPAFLAFVVSYFVGPRLSDLRRDAVGQSHTELWSTGDLSEQGVYWSMIATLLVISVVVVGLAGVISRRGHKVPALVVLVTVFAASLLFWEAVGIRAHATDLLFQSAIPLLVFSLLAFGEFMLITRSGMREAQHEDFVLAARAKGLREKDIRDRHVGRSAILVTLSRLAVSIPYLLTGLVIIERAVNFQGLGTFLFAAIETQDTPTVVGTLAVIGLIGLAVQIGLDVVLVTVDPRLRTLGPAQRSMP